MSIDNLTYKEMKEIAAMFLGEKKKNNLFSNVIGKYVLVRSRNEGLNAGFLVEADETGCVLSEARRLWYHRPAVKSECWYEGVANHGLADDSKLSPAVKEKVIIEDYSITLCTSKAAEQIKAFKSHEQS